MAEQPKLWRPFIALPHPERSELEIVQLYSFGADWRDETVIVSTAGFAKLLAAMVKTDRQATIDAITQAFPATAPPNRSKRKAPAHD